MLRLTGIRLTEMLFFSRQWYANGDYLVLLVSLFIILPLSLLKNLGELFTLKADDSKNILYF